MISSASSTRSVNGFSTKQCHPRLKNDRASAWCAGVGAAITTALVSGGNSSADRNAGTPCSDPNAWAFSRFKSAMPTNRAWPNPAKIRAWCRPIWPTPTTPTEIRSDSGQGASTTVRLFRKKLTD
jgi:hypothetical protein